MRLAPLAVLALATLASCGRPSAPPSAEKDDQPFLSCARSHIETGRETFKLPPLVVERAGADVDVRGLDRGVVMLGLIAGITEASPENLANVAFFLGRFKDAGVQAILVPGGVGLAPKDVSGILEALAAAPIPILVSPGAQESFDVLAAAIDDARKRHPQILDMTRVRRVRLGSATVLSLPGYYRAFYLEAGERGCSYGAGDLLDAMSLAEKGRANVLLAASPPRGSGDPAVDRGRGAANIGDPALASALSKAGIRFGLFGHVYESGGHATLADGATPVSAGVWQDSLYLQAGAADAVPVSLVGGGRSVGLAHVIEISGNRARYRSIAAHKAAAAPVSTPAP
jgi:hypothetical protein